MSSSDALTIDHLLDVLEPSDSLEEGYGVSGLFIGLQSVFNNQRNLRDVVYPVSSGKNQRNDATSSNGGGSGVPLLFDIDSSMPSSPCS